MILTLCGMMGVQPGWTQATSEPSADSPAIPASGTQKLEQDERVLARVGERKLTVGDFRQFVMTAGLGDLTRTQQGQIRLLRLLIEELLLDQALELEGFLEAGATDRETRVNAMSRLRERHFPLPPPPDEAAVRAYYDANREQFGIPELVRIVQIQFRADQDQPASPSARERAEQALQRIEDGEDFRKIAAELTENPRARELGPDRGFLPRNAEPWLREALQDLTPGQRTGIVRSPAGYEILLVTDWRAPIIADFEIVRTAVAERIRQSAQQQAREAYVKKIAQKIGVEITWQGMEDANPVAH
ncbi:MAG: peptidylprolyl isomerase [Candidatus Competibacteraceae bacterium]